MTGPSLIRGVVNRWIPTDRPAKYLILYFVLLFLSGDTLLVRVFLLDLRQGRVVVPGGETSSTSEGQSSSISEVDSLLAMSLNHEKSEKGERTEEQKGRAGG